MRINLSLPTAALLIAALAPSAFAGRPFEPGEVRVSAEFEPAEAKPGEFVELQILVEIAPGWHIYSPDEENESALPTTLRKLSPTFEALGSLTTDDDAIEHELPGTGTIHYFEEKVLLTQNLLVAVDAKPGTVKSIGELRFLPCTMEKCLKPTTAPIEASFEVLEADVEADDQGSEVEGDDVEAAGEGEDDSEGWSDGEVRIVAEIEPTQAAPGDEVELTLRLSIAPEWHVYAPDDPNPYSLPSRFDPGEAFENAGDLAADHEPEKFTIPGAGDYLFFEGNVVFTQKLVVAASATPGAQELIGEFVFLPCTKEYCLEEMKVPVRLAFEVLAGGAPAGGASRGDDAAQGSASSRSTEGDALKESIEQGLPAFMSVCAFFALLALLTPCVYPMIPITVSYFTKAAHSNRIEALGHAFAYMLGIIGTYVGFGVGIRYLLGDQGPNIIATNGWVNLAVAAIFVVFGFSLLGSFDLRLPSSWVDGMNRIAGRSAGYLGDLLLGFAFTLAAFTCTVPIVALILRLGVDVSTFHMFLGMLTYATVFAAPFFVLALVPSLVKSMPRSGGWLNSVKVALAFIELAAAFKFLSAADFYFFGGVLFTYRVVVLSWAVMMGLTGVYLMGWVRFSHDTPVESISPMRMLSATGFLVFALYLSGGGYGQPLAPWIASLAPPNLAATVVTGGGSAASQEVAPWEVSPHANGPKEWKLAQEHAASTGKPIFLEFSGFT